MRCETCNFQWAYEFIGLAFSVSRDINALPGRLRGVRRNFQSAKAEIQAPQKVQVFSGRLGIDSRGNIDVIYDDLGGAAMSDSIRLSIAKSIARKDGMSSTNRAQLRQYDSGPRRGIEDLKSGENILTITLNGKDEKDGIGFIISTRNGEEINSISRLLPDMTSDQIKRLFQLIAKKKGEIVNLAGDDKGIIFMGIKDVDIDLGGDEFAKMINIARGMAEKKVIDRKVEIRVVPDLRIREFAGNRAVFNTVGLSKGAQMPVVVEREMEKLKKASFKLGDEVVRKKVDDNRPKTVVVNGETSKLGDKTAGFFEEEEREVEVKTAVKEPTKGRSGGEMVEVNDEEKEREDDYEMAPLAINFVPSLLVEERKAVLKTFKRPKEKVDMGHSDRSDVPAEEETESSFFEQDEKVLPQENIEPQEVEFSDREIDAKVKEEGSGGSQDDTFQVVAGEAPIKDRVVPVTEGDIEERVQVCDVSATESNGITQDEIVFDKKDISVRENPEKTGEDLTTRMVIDSSQGGNLRIRIIDGLSSPYILVKKIEVPQVIFDANIGKEVFLSRPSIIKSESFRKITGNDWWQIETGAMLTTDLNIYSGYVPIPLTLFVPAILYMLKGLCN